MEEAFEMHIITSSIIIQWIIIILAAALSIFLTSNMKKNPGKRQSAIEIFVNFISNLVHENIGEKRLGFVAYVGTLGIYLLLLNLVPLTGFKAPTEDFSVCLGLALISFIVIQAHAIRKVGVVHYFTGFGKPFLPLLPLNVVERVILPVSLTLRLFGNLTASAVIMKLTYDVLSSVNIFAQLVIPIPLHVYFDAFDAAIQTVIFVMLTMINAKVAAEH